MENKHFGTKTEEEAPPSRKEEDVAASITSFGHRHAAPELKPERAGIHQPHGALRPQQEDLPPEGLPPPAPEDGKGAQQFTPPVALQEYLRSLSAPDALPMVESVIDAGDNRYREKIERYAEIISKELHSKADAHAFASENQLEARKALIESVNTILAYKKYDLIPSETADIQRIIESDVFGLGPLDELLADDDISDIMVDGPNEVFIEMNGQIDKTGIRFRSEEHLLNICQRIVSRVGRHVDKASPICDARLPDGSRVNVILPPLSLKGPILTIRKFKKEKLTLDKLLSLGTVDARTASLLKIMTACRVNLLVTGGTGSGKTTLLNCLTKYISPRERIITCEDAAELQLQQQQVVSLETRPTSTEGVGLVTMRDLVRNCLRMRPDRIIVGEVRGPEAFDLLQAMNTGHDGSMGTFHANSPRDALFRLENMVSMANLSIPVSAIREQISSSLEVIIHTQRLRDGSRKVMNITEITGLTDNMVSIQDIVSYEITGESKGRLQGKFRFSSFYPRFRDKARHYNLEGALLEVMNAPEEG